jgi:hypothetical protein
MHAGAQIAAAVNNTAHNQGLRARINCNFVILILAQRNCNNC